MQDWQPNQFAKAPEPGEPTVDEECHTAIGATQLDGPAKRGNKYAAI